MDIVCILHFEFCITEMSLHLILLVVYSLAIVDDGPVDRALRANEQRVLRRGPQPRTGPRVRLDAGRKHRCRRHGQRCRTRLSRRVECVVVERIGGPRVVRARVLGRPATLGARQGARLLHDRRLPGVPLRSHGPRGDHGSRRASAVSGFLPRSSSPALRSSTSSPARRAGSAR